MEKYHCLLLYTVLCHKIEMIKNLLYCFNENTVRVENMPRLI